MSVLITSPTDGAADQTARSARRVLVLMDGTRRSQSRLHTALAEADRCHARLQVAVCMPRPSLMAYAWPTIGLDMWAFQRSALDDYSRGICDTIPAEQPLEIYVLAQPARDALSAMVTMSGSDVVVLDTPRGPVAHLRRRWALRTARTLGVRIVWTEGESA